MIAVIPLLLNVYLNALFVRNLKPHELVPQMRPFPLFKDSTFIQTLYINHPLLNIFLYIGIAGLYGVFFSNLILLLGQLLRKKYLLLLLSVVLPFLLIPVYYIAGSVTPLIALMTTGPKISLQAVLCMFAIIGVIQILLIVYFIRSEIR